MPRIPANVDSALSALREEAPSSESAAKARAAISRPRSRRVMPRYVVSAVGIAAIVAGLTWPRESVASWGKALSASQDAPTKHSFMRDEKGNLLMETWRDGKRMYVWLRGQTARGQTVVVNDGKRIFDYFDFHSRQHQLPNARPNRGLVVTADHIYNLDMSGGDALDTLLKRKNVRLISHQTVTEGGRQIERYAIEETWGKFKESMTVDADAATGLIRRIQRGKAVIEIEYPATVPQEVFDWKRQVPPGVVVDDLDAQRAQIADAMKHGPTADGVTLRAAMVDGSGDLWVVWTGVPTDGRLAHPIRVRGMKTGQAYGLAALTSKGPDRRSPVVGERVYGMAVPLYQKLTSPTLSIDLWNGKRYVNFPKVKWLEIHDIGTPGVELGMFKPPRP